MLQKRKRKTPALSRSQDAIDRRSPEPRQPAGSGAPDPRSADVALALLRVGADGTIPHAEAERFMEALGIPKKAG